MGREGLDTEKEREPRDQAELSKQNENCGNKKRKLEDEIDIQAKKACVEDEVVLEYLDGENEGIAVLSLNRPSSRNALSWKLVDDVQTALDEVGREQGACCLIMKSLVTGVFSSGADLKERTNMSEQKVLAYIKKLKDLVASLEELQIPVIAACEGAALGGGLEVILGCDMRVGTTSSMFGLPETRLGVIPGAGGTVRLGKVIGWGRARQMILTACRISGKQAEMWGLLNVCVEDGAAYYKALEMARAVVEGAPLAVRMAKVALKAAERLEQEEALEVEQACYENILPSWDRVEGLRAWGQRRKPKFMGK
eukprot:GFUD01000665.1.p1 GENE.GFUD01000665.1~~GFUD01000665.1.p1  ORF type:complete len:310 (+),score=91.60 GFUD01000665.1:113-1042(+)